MRQFVDEQTRAHGGAKKLIDRARDEILHCHYRRALKQLKQIPPEHLTEDAILLRNEAVRLRDESHQLADRIREAVETKNPDGLLPMVRRYHEIRPHDKSIARLKDYLEGKISGKPCDSETSDRHLPPDLPPACLVED